MTSIAPPPPVPSVIVTLRWNTSALVPGATERAQELAREAAAHGATLCAFGPFELSFAFGEADALEAASFAARVVQEGGELGRAGMAYGDVAPFVEEEGFIQLAVGAPIVIATALARFAQPGEVIVDAPLARLGLRLLPLNREVTLGGRTRAAFLLDLSEPAGDEADLEAMTPVDAAVRAPPVPAIQVRESDAPPVAREMLVLAREALAKNQLANIDEVVAELKLTEDHADVIERLAGVLAMTQGAKEEGLRVLRRAVETEDREDKRGRALLAYAIGVAAAGRPDDALLEALASLSIARARRDRSGEKACARFLAQLSHVQGHKDAASAWEHVARAAEADG